MITINGEEVLLSAAFALGTGQNEARLQWPKGYIIVRFGGENDGGAVRVTPSMFGSDILLTVGDEGQNLGYSYNGSLNEDGAPAFSVNLVVTPIGDGKDRPRAVCLTIARGVLP